MNHRYNTGAIFSPNKDGKHAKNQKDRHQRDGLILSSLCDLGIKQQSNAQFHISMYL
jgi:hypothetical protein